MSALSFLIVYFYLQPVKVAILSNKLYTAWTAVIIWEVLKSIHLEDDTKQNLKYYFIKRIVLS